MGHELRCRRQREPGSELLVYITSNLMAKERKGKYHNRSVAHDREKMRLNYCRVAWCHAVLVRIGTSRIGELGVPARTGPLHFGRPRNTDSGRASASIQI
jgi:hypothetical protein